MKPVPALLLAVFLAIASAVGAFFGAKRVADEARVALEAPTLQKVEPRTLELLSGPTGPDEPQAQSMVSQVTFERTAPPNITVRDTTVYPSTVKYTFNGNVAWAEAAYDAAARCTWNVADGHASDTFTSTFTVLSAPASMNASQLVVKSLRSQTDGMGVTTWFLDVLDRGGGTGNTMYTMQFAAYSPAGELADAIVGGHANTNVKLILVSPTSVRFECALPIGANI